jgi:hypothetical protein
MQYTHGKYAELDIIIMSLTEDFRKPVLTASSSAVDRLAVHARQIAAYLKEKGFISTPDVQCNAEHDRYPIICFRFASKEEMERARDHILGHAGVIETKDYKIQPKDFIVTFDSGKFEKPCLYLNVGEPFVKTITQTLTGSAHNPHPAKNPLESRALSR